MSVDVAETYRLLIADVYELAGTSRRTSEHVARRHGRTAAQVHVLSVLTDGERTVPSIARRLGLSRQAIQRVVHDLAAAHQVTTRVNPADARAPLVRLTPAGRRTVPPILAESDGERDEILSAAGISAAELARARRTLRRLLDAVASGGRTSP